MPRPPHQALHLSFALLVGACTPFAADTPPLNTNRPLLSEDTGTVAADHAELEIGGRLSDEDDADVPTAFKFGAGEHTEVFFEWSPWIHVPHFDDAQSDVLLGARHRLRNDGDGPSLAVQATGDVPVGDDDSGGDHVDLFAAVIATQRWGGTSLTAFYQFGGVEVGEASAEVEHLLSISAVHSFDQRWAVFGELAGVLRPESDTEASVSTAGLSFATSPTCVWDASVAHGQGDDATDLVFSFGVTLGLGRWR